MTPVTLKILLSISLLVTFCLAFVFGCGYQAKADSIYNWRDEDESLLNVVKTLLVLSLAGTGFLLYLVYEL